MDERLHSPLLPRRMSSIGSTVGLRLACLPTNILAPDLAAYRARLSDPSSLRADFSLPPVCISVGAHCWVRLYLAFRGVHRFPFPAQLLRSKTQSSGWEENMNRPRAADDFAAIRARMGNSIAGLIGGGAGAQIIGALVGGGTGADFPGTGAS